MRSNTQGIEMMKTACVVLLLAISTSALAAEKPVVTLWPKGLPSDAKPIDAARVKSLLARQTAERITYVAEPTLTLYRAPAKTSNGCGVVICPGGGYNILAWPKEGLEVAEWFNSIGVTAVVLKYRVPRRDPKRPHWEPLQDAQRAIRIMRKNAADWGVDSNRIGILGFSAGGHLTVMAGTHYQDTTYDRVDDADDLSARPDFMCPIYAAYLGNDYKDNRAEIGSLVRITKETPPTFMAVTLDDTFRGVQAGMLLAKFKQAGVPAEAHIYSTGGHGYGIRPSSNPISTWHLRLGEWMKVRGLLNRAD
jgi:acetyl esterase/lipase